VHSKNTRRRNGHQQKLGYLIFSLPLRLSCCKPLTFFSSAISSPFQLIAKEIIAIINPNSGPDSAGPDSSYTTYMKKLTAAGVDMVGYVHTSYGARAVSDVNVRTLPSFPLFLSSPFCKIHFSHIFL
jgi:hypothetical protein